MNEECFALFKKMSEYIDGELDSDIVLFAEKHLEGCVACGDNLDFMKKSIQIIKKSFSYDIPDSIRLKLRDIINEELEKIMNEGGKK